MGRTTALTLLGALAAADSGGSAVLQRIHATSLPGRLLQELADALAAAVLSQVLSAQVLTSATRWFALLWELADAPALRCISNAFNRSYTSRMCKPCYANAYVPDAVDTFHVAGRIVLHPNGQHFACHLHKVVSSLLCAFLRDPEVPADAQWTRGARSGLPTIEAALRLLLRLAAPALGAGSGTSAAPAHRLFILNAIPRLAQVPALGHSP